ncbi:hypothetical protein OA40_02520 [Morganella morganii]|uniref:hypothetical protein n=1 Tax=Morganella morganii TaxID=582 RepID=UPI00062C6622|nr:hypothetical protein [Morganella morganii]KKY70292.1 hypothetical protein OA40_02520 [Morganella morganii]
MSVNKEYQIVNLMRYSLSIIFIILILFLTINFLWDAKSDQVSKFSAFFTALSSLGIIVTILIYLYQKEEKLNSEVKKTNDKKNAITLILIDVILNSFISFSMTTSSTKQGNKTDALKYIGSIDVNTISNCLYDSADVSKEMFLEISIINTAIRQYQTLIIEQIENYEINDKNTIYLVKSYCDSAISEIKLHIDNIKSISL